MSEEQKDAIEQVFEAAQAFAVMNVNDLKERPEVVQAIRFDVTPKMIMEPRVGPEGVKQADLKGFSFYIEAFDEPPKLMIMKVSRSNVMTTNAWAASKTCSIASFCSSDISFLLG